MATLMAIDLADAGIQPNKLVTAGSPRVGDE